MTSNNDKDTETAVRQMHEHMFALQTEAGRASYKSPDIVDEAEAAKQRARDEVFDEGGNARAFFGSQATLDKMNGITPEERKALNAQEASSRLWNEYTAAYVAPPADGFRLIQTAEGVWRQQGYSQNDLDDPNKRREFIGQVALTMGHQRRTAPAKAKADDKGEPSELAAAMHEALSGHGGAGGDTGGDVGANVPHTTEAQNAAWVRQLGDMRVKAGLR